MGNSYDSAVLTAPRRVELRQLATPRPGPHEVVVRLEGCGICGSNLPVWQGRDWFTYPLEPGNPGHEGWGLVEDAGDEVEGFAPGDRVALLSYHAFAEIDVASAGHVMKLPPELDDLPFPGEALGCAMNVMARAGVEAGDRVAIIGIGFLGALLTQLAIAAGASVTAISRRSQSLEIARSAGSAEEIVLDDHHIVLARCGEIAPQGFDRVIEATGHQWPLDIAGEIVAERGKIIIAGYHQDGLRQVNMQLWNWKGIDVINAHERDPGVYMDGMSAAAAAIAAGTLDPAPLYTHRFGLDQLASGLDALESRAPDFMKGLVLL